MVTNAVIRAKADEVGSLLSVHAYILVAAD